MTFSRILSFFSSFFSMDRDAAINGGYLLCFHATAFRLVWNRGHVYVCISNWVGMHSQILFLKSNRKSIDYGVVIGFSRLSVARSSPPIQ
jgi:hypothetical protein